MKKLFILPIIALLSFSSAAWSQAKVKCYGVAQAGQNDCAANGHGCATYAKKDYDPSEWKYMSKEECENAKKELKDK